MQSYPCPRERIIEYRLNVNNIGPLAHLSVEKFVLSVGARTSAPGGGSVAALLAGLVSIPVGWLNHNEKSVFVSCPNRCYAELFLSTIPFFIFPL